MKNYYKTIDADGQTSKLQCSPVDGLGTKVSKTEYCMMKCAIKVFINGEDPDKIKAEEWWK